MENRPTTWNGVEVPFGASIDQLASLVRGPIPERWAAFVALAHTPGQSALAILADSARSSDPHVRRVAVEAIGVHPDRHRLGALICGLLSDTHDFEDALPRHRQWACELAGRYGSRDVLTELKRLTDDVDGHVRVTAARAIAEIEARENP